MGSTGEPDRKRRHLGSVVSPTPAKKHPFLPVAEDKKLDAAVLEYQNQKLLQQLEVQRSEFSVLENKFSQTSVKQHHHDDALTIVNRAWEKLAHDLDSVSSSSKTRSNGSCHLRPLEHVENEPSCSIEDSIQRRLLDKGAVDTSSSNIISCHVDRDFLYPNSSATLSLRNIVTTVDTVLEKNNDLFGELLLLLPDDESGKQLKETVCNLKGEVKIFRVKLHDLHLKQRLLRNEVQCSRDVDAKNKSEIKRLAGELESSILELRENKNKVAMLKAQKDSSQGASFPVLNFGTKHGSGEKVKEKPRELQDIESAVRGSSELALNRLGQLRSAYEERVDILKQLASLQNSLKDVKHISSSPAFMLLSNELEKTKAEIDQYLTMVEKLQVEKDDFAWRDRSVSVEIDVANISQKASAIADCRIGFLQNRIRKQTDEGNMLEIKLEEAINGSGVEDIMTGFKIMVNSLHKKMDEMQVELSKNKEVALDIHSLRAEVQSLSNVLNGKADELETLSRRCSGQVAEVEKLESVVFDLRESSQELKLILEMYEREQTDPRDVIEARDLEYQARAHVQSLKSTLDEHTLELRVKSANEAEALSQQRLAAAEAIIADLRLKFQTSERELIGLSELLKSKSEEGEAYLSEIETIGQAYGDVQAQNDHLLLQITERDDYNVKLVLEIMKAKQLQNMLLMDIEAREKELQHANASVEFYKLKAMHNDDQTSFCSEQLTKMAEDVCRGSSALEGSNKRFRDLQADSIQLRQSLDESRLKVEKSRDALAEVLIESEGERFKKRRDEEELEVLSKKAALLNARTDGLSLLRNLQEEIGGYKALLNCSECQKRPKEVVITKCYHLFCNSCIQRTRENRHRKCPICSASFGQNDVRNVYI